MTTMQWTILFSMFLIVGLICFAIGYRIGKQPMKPGGRVIFENYVNEKDEPATHVVFQLDVDLDELENMRDILLEIRKENKQ